MMPLTLAVRRRVGASPDRVFAAWTDPAQIVRWWGPPGVTCPAAEVDLRVGGRYRLANRLPDGNVLWITGVYEAIDRPRRLVYSWAHEPVGDDTEWTRVSVDFAACDIGTEVVVVHERFLTEAARDVHADGWAGCLDRLVASMTD